MRGRLYPELSILDDAADRKAVAAACWKRVRREKHVVAWGVLFGGAVAPFVGFVLMPAIAPYLPLPRAARAVALGVAFGVCCVLVLRAIVYKPMQQAIRRALHERGLPVCRPCGYNLTGNVSGVCPECGTPIEKPEPKP